MARIYDRRVIDAIFYGCGQARRGASGFDSERTPRRGGIKLTDLQWDRIAALQKGRAIRLWGAPDEV